MKNYLIAGNWKMNTDAYHTEKLIKEIIEGYKVFEPNVKVLICPPFTNLMMATVLLSDTDILLGAQNCHYEAKGAFTGEISVDMLKCVGCEYIIIGHSERRAYFYENDEIINKKLKTVLTNNLKPIFCIGETMQQRQEGLTFSVIEKQIEEGLKGISLEYAKNLVIAYEPVWAIGTGLAATPEQVDEVHNKIRQLIENLFGKIGKETLILYGGSVTSGNADKLLNLKNVNGALIGGASLNAVSFLSIINSAQQNIKK